MASDEVAERLAGPAVVDEVRKPAIEQAEDFSLISVFLHERIQSLTVAATA